MRLYAGMSGDFVQDAMHNTIAERLKSAFFHHFRYYPSPSEVNSWRNSLRATSDVFQMAKLDDQGVILEYQLPLTSKRLDCLVCGRDAAGSDQGVIIELKQWETTQPSLGDDLVSAWVGGGQSDLLHPSAQVRQYQLYLQDTHTAFYEGAQPVALRSCAYLHNYFPSDEDALFAPKFSRLLQEYPCFVGAEAERLAGFLQERLASGHGHEVLARVEESKYRTSKKLMDHVGAIIKGKSEYVLLDEQLVVYEQVRALAAHALKDPKKTALLVQGGPGTGKSVIALNLMSDLLLGGTNAHYATGSRAFTGTLRNVIGARGSAQFKYFNSYATAEHDEIDVLICDEAHRIRETSNDRFTPKAERSNKPQIRELLEASKLSVFLIDDRQGVRPGEIGSSDYIRAAATEYGCRVVEHKLEAQFRCAGSDGFVNWITNTLGIERTANTIYEAEEAFDFRIAESPEALDTLIRARAADGSSARLVAGFCWPWSPAKPDGTLVEDVAVGSFRRPWNARPEARRLAKGIPPATLWANEAGGIEQVGCVYTAQGFEFDYVGVIWGPDLVYDFALGAWRGQKDQSFDSTVKRAKEAFAELVKNTYRVLLSRGLKGCYVCFLDKDTERFVRSRAELGPARQVAPAAAMVPSHALVVAGRPEMPFHLLPEADVRPFQNCVPLYDLKVAAGRFGHAEAVAEHPQTDEVASPHGYRWVELPPEFRPSQGLFVAQVVGESMNRRIPNGAWCLFRLAPAGSRQGRVVLAQHRSIEDPETGGRYTVKVYESRKKTMPDGTWRHSAVVLRPDSLMPGYEPLTFAGDDAEDIRIIAELVAVLG